MSPSVQIDIWNYISLRNCGKQLQSDLVPEGGAMPASNLKWSL